MEEMQLLMHGVFQVSEGQYLKYQLFATGNEVLLDPSLDSTNLNLAWPGNLVLNLSRRVLVALFSTFVLFRIVTNVPRK